MSVDFSITLDFWFHACSAVDEIFFLKEIRGQYLFQERFFPPQKRRGSFTIHGCDWTFPLFPLWDLIKKSHSGTFDFGLE